MTSFRAFTRGGLAAAACVALAGCVSVFPKAVPAQLYRFGAADSADAAPAVTAGPGIVALGQIEFVSAAANDRILTVNGEQTAYVAEARWVSPAPILFAEALERTFENTPGAPRLVRRGGSATTPMMLSLNVETFETRYDQGENAAPLVVVKVRALLVRVEGRGMVAEQPFYAEQRASDNRVGAIAQAYDQAVAKSLSDLAAWTTMAAKPAA